MTGMRSARFGRIVNVSSLVARGLPFRSSYAAAKSALESLTRSMAVELAPDGITANAVAPGPTETELFRENNPKGGEGGEALSGQSADGTIGESCGDRGRDCLSH
jgi:3-oxoacyl-[acyl-carrier protein] reductase